MGWPYERLYGQVGYFTNVGPHLHVNRSQVSLYLSDTDTLSIAASSLNNVFTFNVKNKELHESNGTRFKIDYNLKAADGKRTTLRRKNDLTSLTRYKGRDCS